MQQGVTTPCCMVGWIVNPCCMREYYISYGTNFYGIDNFKINLYPYIGTKFS